MNTTLLIMAAGIGSRFGTGIKQLEPVDDAGHIIMDYSIHDAIEAGFNHVVFIIRKDIEREFKEVIGDRIASILLVQQFAFKVECFRITVQSLKIKFFPEHHVPVFIKDRNQMKFIMLVFQIVEGTPIIGIFTCDVF